MVILMVAGAGLVQPATVSGVVRDPSGSGVPGAEVTLKPTGGQSKQTLLSQADGGFRFASVAPGDYSIEVRRDGFEVWSGALRVGARSAPALLVQLRLADLLQQVTVESEAVGLKLDHASNRNAVTVGRELLDALPMLDQDYITALSRFVDPSATATSGVAVSVDGVEVNNVNVAASAIQEVKINQNPFSAEFARPGKGRIDVVTRPGTTQPHGTFNFLFRDHHLNARDAFALERASEQRRIYEGTLTGPLGDGKKTSFLIAINREEEDQQTIVNAFGPDGAVRENVPIPLRFTLASWRVNRQQGENNTIAGGYNFRSWTMDHFGAGAFVLPEASSRYEFYEHEVVYNQRTVITPHLLNQVNFLAGRFRWVFRALGEAPRVVVLESFTGGGAQIDNLRTENHFTLHQVLTWNHGRHFVKTGFSVPDISRRAMNDLTNSLGSYYFSSIDDYRQRRPYSASIQQGDPRLVFVEKVFGGFAQDDFNLRPNLSVSLGVRYDYQNFFHDAYNFSPRAALAWSPDRARRIVVRAGGGLFYDRTGAVPIADFLRYDGVHLRRYVLSDPAFPVDPGTLAALPVGLVRLDPAVRIPYTAQYSLALERRLSKSATLAATYTGSRGIGVFRSRDVNAPLPPLYAGRPNPAINQWRQIESSGRLATDMLELTFRGNLGTHFSGFAQYTLGRAHTDTAGIYSFPADSYRLGGEWARADYDQRHQFNLLGTINQGKLLNLGLGVTLASGKPYNMTTGRDDNRDGLANDRPAGVSRNTLEAEGVASLDLRWSREIKLTKLKGREGPSATLAVDAFNVTNRVNYTVWIGNLSSPFFGRPVVAQPPRRLQFAMRFKF